MVQHWIRCIVSPHHNTGYLEYTDMNQRLSQVHVVPEAKTLTSLLWTRLNTLEVRITSSISKSITVRDYRYIVLFITTKTNWNYHREQDSWCFRRRPLPRYDVSGHVRIEIYSRVTIGCGHQAIDLSPSAFYRLANKEKGRINVAWAWAWDLENPRVPSVI